MYKFTIIELPSGAQLRASKEEVELTGRSHGRDGNTFLRLNPWEWSCLVSAVTTATMQGGLVYSSPAVSVEKAKGYYLVSSGGLISRFSDADIAAIFAAWVRWKDQEYHETLSRQGELLAQLVANVQELGELVDDLGPGTPLVVVDNTRNQDQVDGWGKEFLEIMRSWTGFPGRSSGEVTPPPIPHPDHLSQQELESWVAWVELDPNQLASDVQTILDQEEPEKGPLSAWALDQLLRIPLGFIPFHFPSWETLAHEMGRTHHGRLFWVTRGDMTGGHPWGRAGGVHPDSIPLDQLQELDQEELHGPIPPDSSPEQMASGNLVSDDHPES